MMHRNAVPSRTWAGNATAVVAVHGSEQESPACPRPRRAGAALPEFLLPLSCQHSHPSLSHEGSSSGALDIISTKNGGGGGRMESKGRRTGGCPPSCYCGSPPSRLENPLIHDVQFLRQAADHSCILSPWMLAANDLYH